MMFVIRTMNDNKMKIKVRILNTSTARWEGGFIFVLLGLKNGHVYTAVVWWCATIYSLDLYGADHVNINPPSQIPLGNFSYKFTLKFGHCEKPCSLTKNIVLGNKHNTEYFSLVDLTCYESIKCSQEK